MGLENWEWRNMVAWIRKRCGTHISYLFRQPNFSLLSSQDPCPNSFPILLLALIYPTPDLHLSHSWHPSLLLLPPISHSHPPVTHLSSSSSSRLCSPPLAGAPPAGGAAPPLVWCGGAPGPVWGAATVSRSLEEPSCYLEGGVAVLGDELGPSLGQSSAALHSLE